MKFIIDLSSKPVSWRYYGLRIGCFAGTLAFTFALPVWPVAALGWLVLGVLFCVDFL
jgi:hypothetical protein